MPVEINEIIITTTVTNNVAGSRSTNSTGQTAIDKKLKKALEELTQQINNKNER